MPGIKRRYEILYRNKPAWIVGEKDDDAVKRRVLLTDVTQSEELYPGSFRGKVISVQPEGHLWTAGDLACPTRSLVTLELTDEEASALRSKKLKLDETGQTLLPITFEDRYGATATNLRRVFPDATVTTEDDERAEIDAVIEANTTAEIAYADALREWKRESAKAFIATRLFDDPKPIVPIPSPVPEPVFAMEVGRLQQKLPKTIVHSGAGLYEVGPGKTYSTIQSALDQLWADQGSAEFTASQTIRIFAGTYTENVTINAGMTANLKHYFRMEANGSDSVTIDGTAGVCIQNLPTGAARFERLTFASTGGWAIHGGTTIYKSRAVHVRDCTFNTKHGFYISTWPRGMAVCTDSTFNCTGTCINVHAATLVAQRCILRGSLGITGYWSADVRACVFDGCGRGIALGGYRYQGFEARVQNCTFYASTTADFQSEWTEGGTRLALMNIVALNNIHKDSACAYWIPEETELANVNHNCFHGCTKVARVGETDKTTLADWQAVTDEWGNSPGAKSTDSDPLLTNPGADDFSLQIGSPCRRKGAGAGVNKDVLENALDPFHPDIGAVSTGVGPWDQISAAALK